jgi:ATP-dependent Clp protease ATP-binding subunit ClpC
MIETAVRDRVTQLGQRAVLDRFQREFGLPEQLIRDDLPLPQSEVLAAFEGQILGQPSACQTAAAVVTALKTGLNDPNRPLGVLLFCGPTGVGKTETAKALARYLFGAAAKERLVRLDMSEYSGYGAAQRLLLSDDGAVSDFLRRVRRQPFVVLLLDEIEKAAPEVLDVLLGVLDEGQLTDRFGRATTFRSAVILMTSNLGAERRSSLGFGDAAQPAFERIAMTAFRPEFFNRIDAVVPFGPLDRATIAKLAERELESIARREGLAMAGRRLTWTPEVLAHLAEAGYDARYGARPLQRAIEREVIAPLSAALLNPDGRTALRFDLILDQGRIVVCVDSRG